MSFAIYNQAGTIKRVSAYYNDKGTIKYPKDMTIYKNIGGKLVQFPHPDKLVLNLDIISWTTNDPKDMFAWMPTPEGVAFPVPTVVLTDKNPDMKIDQQGVIPGYAFYSNRISGGILANPWAASIWVGKKPLWKYEFNKNKNVGDPVGSMSLSFYVKFRGTPEDNKNYYGDFNCRLINIGGTGFSFLFRTKDKYVAWDRGFNGGIVSGPIDVGWTYKENEWAHVVITIERKDTPNDNPKRRDIINTYFNGKRIKQDFCDNGYPLFTHDGHEPAYTSDFLISFGRAHYLQAWDYNNTAAYLRSARTWDIALTPQQVTDLYEFEKIIE